MGKGTKSKLLGFVVDGTCTVTDPWLSFIDPGHNCVGLMVDGVVI